MHIMQPELSLWSEPGVCNPTYVRVVQPGRPRSYRTDWVRRKGLCMEARRNDSRYNKRKCV